MEFLVAPKTDNPDGRQLFCHSCLNSKTLHERRMIAQHYRRKEKRPVSREERLRVALQVVVDRSIDCNSGWECSLSNTEMEQIKEALK